METIGKSRLWSFLDGQDTAVETTCDAVRESEGHLVGSYLELARKVAELQFRNREHVLVFRGQAKNYTSRGRNTSLKPGLFREDGESLPPLERRYKKLIRAEELLIQASGSYWQPDTPGDELTLIERQQILRWAVIQHYEICPTPLLDVSLSLRIAASFASNRAKGEAFLYVLGVPNLSGSVTVSAEAGLQIVRLASVCPPLALRPHIQEGYLLSEYPDLGSHDQKMLYRSSEVDFARRLVAKFRFRHRGFWKQRQGFPLIKVEALYPSVANDPLRRMAETIKAQLAREYPS